jgi:hypothetical protein
VGWDRFRLDALGDGDLSEAVLGGLEVLPAATNRLLQDRYCVQQEPNSTTDLGSDISEAEVARATINYLMVHQPVVAVSFPEDDPPSQEMLRLVAPHVEGMEQEMAELVARYLCESLAPHLGLSGIVMG